MADRIVRGRSRSLVLPGGRQRLTEWQGSPNVTAFTTLPANTFLIFASLTVAELAKRPFTITRTVGTLFVRSDQTAAREFPFGAMGMMVVSEKAVTTGATAVPDPITEQESDEWYVYQAMASIGTGSVAEPNIMSFPFDSRAQRKVQDGEDTVTVLANGSAAFGLDFYLNFRQLVKLS